MSARATYEMPFPVPARGKQELKHEMALGAAQDSVRRCSLTVWMPQLVLQQSFGTEDGPQNNDNFVRSDVRRFGRETMMHRRLLCLNSTRRFHRMPPPGRTCRFAGILSGCALCPSTGREGGFTILGSPAISVAVSLTHDSSTADRPRIEWVA